jgi:hypothetical protein
LQRIKKGTSDAQQLTLSFWVKSNVTGTYVLELFDIDNTRRVGATYSVSASATWERKVVTFPADTTGAFDNDNASSFSVNWWLAAGSDFTSGTLNTTWASSTNANRAVGQVNLAAATSNYWQVTGVQLEVGPAATPFEFKSFGQELRECQRYYWRCTASNAYSAIAGAGYTTSTTNLSATTPTPPMRVTPTAIDISNSAVQDSAGGIFAVSSATVDTNQSSNIFASANFVSSGLTSGRYARVVANNNAAAYVGFSAEL